MLFEDILSPMLAGGLRQDHIPLYRYNGKLYRLIDCIIFFVILNFILTPFNEIKIFEKQLQILFSNYFFHVLSHI